MNAQHIHAIRQLNQQRDFHARMLLSGASARQAAGAIDHISNIDVQMSQLAKSEYREQEEILAIVLRNGMDKLSNAQRATVKNAMSTTTGSQGGYTVPATIGLMIADALQQFSSMRRIAAVVVTQTGAAMGWPNSDGRSETGELLGQNGAAAALDPSFGTAPLNTFKFGSKVITAPLELVQDSSLDIVAFIAGRIAARIGRITNAKYTTGAGTTEPLGVVTAVAVGKTGATGQTVSVIQDDLVDLVASVDPAYRESAQCAWMMHDTTLTYIRKLKDSTGQPLKLVKTGMRANGEPDTIDGFPVIVNNDMPVMAADAKSILFGDFSKYVIRDTPEVSILVLTDSAYALKGQIGYLGMARSGGAYVDAGTAIMAYQNAAT